MGFDFYRDKNMTMRRPLHRWQSKALARHGLPTFALALGLSSISVNATEPSCTATEPPMNDTGALSDGVGEPAIIYADSAETIDVDTLHLRGNVIVTQDSQQIEADELTYNRNSGELHATDNVRFNDPNLTIHAGRVDMILDAKQGSFHDASYLVIADGAQGIAEQIDKDQEVVTLNQSTYSTCPPEAQSWHLQTGELKLDNTTETGTAKHITLRVQDVPVLYMPYLQFPTSEKRRSGFLFPKIGYGHDDGLRLEAPYYFNLAPQFDDTLTPRYMAKRGVMLENEFRYISKPQVENSIFIQYLPNDDRFDDEDRKSLSWDHYATLGRNWRTSLDLNYVSDNLFFDDFGNDLDTTTQVYIPRTGEISYWGPDLRFGVRVEGFQAITSPKPYQKVPQITLGLTPQRLPGGFRFDISSEAVEFTRLDQDRQGKRYDVVTSLSRPFSGSAYFFMPKVWTRHTHYEIDNQTVGFDDTITRSLPGGSVDAGLFFERHRRWLGTNAIQTLEPRLFYLYVPTRDHDGIPLFDTGPFTFGYDQLFRENRFTGIDRIGDTQQLTVALTSRVISDQRGSELLRASFGQIFYFDEREVQLDTAAAPLDESESDYAADISAKLGTYWSARYGIVWNNDSNKTATSSVALQYRNPSTTSVFNIGYYTQAETLEQTDLSFVWPVSNSINLLGRTNYSIQDQRSIEHLYGLEYETCCWSVRFVDRHQLNAKSRLRRSTMLEFELKGLGYIGDGVRSALYNSILGYPKPD